MSHHPVGRRTEIIHVALDHLAGRRTEQHGLDIIPLPADRIDPVTLPQEFQHIVLAREKLAEIDQDRQRLPFDFPPAGLDPYVMIGEQHLFPLLEQRRVLLEFEVDILAVHVGSDQDVMVSQLFRNCQRFGCDHGMDAADLVAHLPTHLEQIVGHLLNFFVV